MPALQVRDCPEPLYKKISECAASERRSISQQILVALEAYLDNKERERQVAKVVDAALPLPPRPWESGYDAYRMAADAADARYRKRCSVLDDIEAFGTLAVGDEMPEVEEIVSQIRAER